MKVLIAVALLCSYICVPAASAQQPDDDINAVAAALPAIMRKVPAGVTAIVYNDRTATLSQQVGLKTGVTFEPESIRLDCRSSSTTGRNVCRLKNTASLVNLGGVRVVGDEAQVFFTIEISSGSETVPIEHYTYAVHLKRSGTTWTVVRVNSAAMS
jgi:hypothetical protein